MITSWTSISSFDYSLGYYKYRILKVLCLQTKVLVAATRQIN